LIRIEGSGGERRSNASDDIVAATVATAVAAVAASASATADFIGCLSNNNNNETVAKQTRSKSLTKPSGPLSPQNQQQQAARRSSSDQGFTRPNQENQQQEPNDKTSKLVIEDDVDDDGDDEEDDEKERDVTASDGDNNDGAVHRCNPRKCPHKKKHRHRHHKPSTSKNVPTTVAQVDAQNVPMTRYLASVESDSDVEREEESEVMQGAENKAGEGATMATPRRRRRASLSSQGSSRSS
jgi:hypothetical protein